MASSAHRPSNWYEPEEYVAILSWMTALQTVKVFLYLAVFSAKQLDTKNVTTGISKECRLKDKSKFTKQIQTTDEYIYQVANQKRMINEEILDTLKDTSIDCKLHEDEDNPRNCKTFNNPTAAVFSYEPNITKDDNDNMEALNKTKIIKVYKLLQEDASEDLNVLYKNTFLYVYEATTYEIIKLPPTFEFKKLTSEEIAKHGIRIGKIIKGEDGKKKIALA